MRLQPLFAATASVGLICAAASAQTIPEEVTLPLYARASGPAPGAWQRGYPSQIVYGHAGGAYKTNYTGAYTPPARFPVERIPVQYLRYYPARWYGLPGSTLPKIAPQVHMPTDTTQLGFYYQRVPTWMPVPGMVPPPPIPSQYNTYRPVAYDVGPSGSRIISSEVVSSQPVNGSAASGSSGATPVPAPAPAPAPSEETLPLQPPPAPAE